MKQPAGKNQPNLDKGASSPPIRGWRSPSVRYLSSIWMPLVLAGLTFLIYSPSLHFGLIYDARTEILTENFITNPANLPGVLSLKVMKMKLLLSDRPGQILYMMLIAAFWGKDPFGYHLGSNLLHAANVALLFVLLRRLIGMEAVGVREQYRLRIQAAIAACVLIFAVHPIAVESVAEVSLSSSLLVVFFTLLALLAATAFRPENRMAALLTGSFTTICALAAVTSKESGIAVALLLPVYWLLYRRNDLKLPWILLIAAATLVTAAFLAAVVSFPIQAQLKLTYLGGSFSQVFLMQPRLWVFMMGKLVWPLWLSPDYMPADTDILSIPLSITILIVVLLLQAWLAFRSRMGALGIAFYWGGLAAVSNFVPLYIIVADRFYYMPLAGCAMQLAALLIMVLRSRRAFVLAVAGCLALVPLLTGLTLVEEGIYINEMAFWSATLKASPTSDRAHAGLTECLIAAGRLDEAMALIQDEVAKNPRSSDPHLLVGKIFQMKGQLDDALAQIQTALDLDPMSAAAYCDLGMILLQKGRVDEAQQCLVQSLQLDPTVADTHYNLGIVLLQKGQVDGAIFEFERACAKDVDFANAHFNLGQAYLQKGQIDGAVEQFQKALALDPALFAAHYNLGTIFFQKGQIDQAIREYRSTIALNPQFTDARYNLGTIFLQKGQLNDAIEQYQAAIEIRPDFAKAHNMLGSAFLEKRLLDQATDQFTEAVRINPNDDDAQNNLARANAMKALGGYSK